jgi:hypothetical protein
MDYISSKEAAEKWGITKRRVQVLCVGDRIAGAKKIGTQWVIPYDAEKPADARVKAKEN